MTSPQDLIAYQGFGSGSPLSSAMSTELNDSTRFQFVDGINPDFAPASIYPKVLASLANPIASSASFAYGTKATVNDWVAFSVGNSSNLKTNNRHGSSPKITILNGVMSFDTPQTHPYMGIGDRVTYGSSECYLKQKIDAYSWWVVKVEAYLVEHPDNVSDPIEVTSIEKAFETLKIAVELGIQESLGTKSAAAIKRNIYVALYEMQDTVDSSIDVSGWTMFDDDDEYRIKIFCPYRPDHCNTRQLRKYVLSPSASFSSGAVLDCDQNNIDVEGLSFSRGSTSNTLDAYIRLHDELSTISRCSIVGDSGAAGDGVGIHVVGSATDTNVFFNFVSDTAGGILVDPAVSDIFYIHNNTVREVTGYGIEVPVAPPVDAFFYNNIVNGSSGVDYAPNVANWLFCLASDSSCSAGSSCVINKTLNFIGDGPEIDNSDIPSCAGEYLFVPDEDCAIPAYDYNGDIIDDTWLKGVIHKTPAIYLSVGNTGNLMSGTPSAQIFNGILVFSADQDSVEISAGCKVTFSDAQIVYLIRKVNDGDYTTWSVASANGDIPVDKLSTSITSISHATDTLYKAVTDSGFSSNPLFVNMLGSSDLIGSDRAVHVMCVSNTSTVPPRVRYINCDFSRRIRISAPCNAGETNGPNVVRWHSGKWNDNLFILTTGSSDGIVNENVNNLLIENLQIQNSVIGVSVIGGTGTTVLNNIVRQCEQGIVFNDRDGVCPLHVIAGNIVYGCEEDGIRLDENIGAKSEVTFAGMTATWYLESILNDSGFGDYTATVSITPGDPVITWGSKSLVITHDGTLTMGDILKKSVVRGVPWGTLIPGFGSAVDAMSETNLEYASAFVDGNPGVSNVYFAVYNNTIIGCGTGLFLDSSISNKFRNAIRCINNLVSKSSVRDYDGTSRHSKLIVMESCWSSDRSTNDFNSRKCEVNITPIFRDESRQDYHINLHDVMSMFNAWGLDNDSWHRVDMDVDHQQNLSIVKRYSVGADAYGFPLNRVIPCSVGSSTAIKTGDVSLFADGGIIEFGSAVNITDGIGVGDTVVFTDSLSGTVTYQLFDRGNETVWAVCNVDGTIPTLVDNGPSDDGCVVDSIGRASASLDGAMHGTDIENLIGGRDLTSIGSSLLVECYKDSPIDDGPASVDSWVTSSEYVIQIESPYTLNKCLVRQRHFGKNDDISYRIEATTGNSAIHIQSSNVFLDGIICLGSDSPTILINDVVDNIGIDKFIIAGGSKGIQKVGTFGSADVSFSTIYDCSGEGIDGPGFESYNVTIVDCDTGFNTPTGACTNCLSQCDTLDFNALSMENCISRDASASGTGCRSGVTARFKDDTVNDFHLARSDINVIRYGKPLLVFACDIDSRLVGDNWSVGSDCGPFPTLNVFFAARNGFVGTNILSGTNVKIDITDGIARFYDSVTGDPVEQINDFFGIGCEISYGSEPVYISEKVSFHKDRWRVVTQYGEAPVDAVDQTVTQATYPFGDLATLFASGLSDFMNGSNPYAFNDLVKAGLNIIIVGYRGNNTTSVVSISGWEQDNRNRLTLLVPCDTDHHCNTVQRASGTRFGAASECAISVATGSTAALTIGSAFTVVDGLSIIANLLADAVNVGVADNVVVKDCFIFRCKNGIAAASGRVGYFINNIVYGALNSGIVCSGNSAVLNCTVHDCSTGHCINNSDSDIVVNTIAGQSGMSGFNNSDFIQACASYDASAGIRNKCRVFVPMDFVDVTDVDKAKWDFNLTKQFVDVRGTGIQMVLNQYHPFGIDQSGWIRGRLWDIGAMEYRANRHVAYSVFTTSPPYNFRDNKTSGTGTLMVRIDIENGSSIARFYDSITGNDVPQVSPFIGIGDIVEAGLGDIHLLEKKSPSRWVVTDRLGDPTSSSPTEVSKIRRAFKSADVAFGPTGILSANYADTNSLVNDEIQIDVAFYRGEYGIVSSPDYAAIRIDSMPTDADYFFRLFTPNDLLKHCNEIQSHTGVVGTGYRNYTLWGQPSAAILITGLYNTEILRMDVSNTFGDGIKCVSCRNTVIESCIASSCGGNGINNPTQTLSLDVMINNLVWGNNLDGIRVGNKTDFGYSEVYIANNTLDQNRRALIIDKPAATPQCGRVYVYNTIGQRSKWVDFAEDHIEIYGWVSYERCISQDGTAGTVAGYNNQANVEVVFSDRANRRYHLNKFEDVELINNGADLYAGIVYSFNYDIANRIRPDTLWDIGAFEFIELIGIGSLCVGETIIAANLSMTLDEPPILNVYLRKNLSNHKKPSVPSEYQFNAIGERRHPVEVGDDPDPTTVSLNDYLSSNNMAARIIVHVQPNSRFEGSFDFGVRPPLSVVVQTDLEDYLSIDENDRQPAGVYYCENSTGPYASAPLIDDSSETLYSEFRSIKMAGELSTNLLSAGTKTRDLRLINCVVQIGGSSIIPDVACDITIINSDVIYSSSAGPFALTMHGASQRFIANTMLLANTLAAASIETGADRVDNCLTFNYGSGGFDIIDPPSSLYDCKVNLNPLFGADTDMGDLSDSYRVIFGVTPETYKEQTFRTSKSSPVLDAGDNSYVNGKDLGDPAIHIEAIVTDAVGSRRIFDSEYPHVDIGVHELRVYRFDITSDNIFRLYQDKLNYSDGAFYPSVRTAPYLDLAEEFDTEDARIDFARESKVVMEVSRPSEAVRLKTDKVFPILATISGVRIDERTMSIVIPKISSNAGYLFSRALDDDRYIIRFDEIAKTLTVYLKPSYNKGLSGSRNPVRNVKFGGSPIYMG